MPAFLTAQTTAAEIEATILEQILAFIPASIPLILMLLLVSIIYWFAHWVLLARNPHLGYESKRPRQLILVSIASCSFVLVIVALPVPQDTRNQLLSLVGLITSAVIALSSTTFVANAMAGFMLRSTKSFKTGDYLSIGDHAGRVTERGLLHTEIQTEDRDLTTVPNLHLITHPYKVVRSSGTIVSTELSIGYDVHHAVLEPLLLSAAKQADLDEPFVRIMSLGDFSVVYRVSGLLEDPKHLLTTRSRLNTAVLDTIHGNNIEIMSPTFMVQRPQPEAPPMIPASVRTKDRVQSKATAEDVAFDKAEAAEQKEQEAETLTQRLQSLETEIKESEGDHKTKLTEELDALKKQAKALEDAQIEQDNEA